tara:strand:- start:379 stop:1167 length:789 start_codon:yes stop_codon:yes gene_type:complete
MKRLILRGYDSFIGKNCIDLLKHKYRIEKFLRKKKIKNSKNTFFFHLSAITSVIKSFENPNVTITTNIKLLIESLEYCQKNKVKLIFFSTAYQQDKKKFTSPYSLSKNICEKICEYYSKEFNMDICIIRLSNIYGNYQKKQLVAEMIHKLKNKKKIEIMNHKVSRDFLYVKDLISALEKLINHFPKKINIYNISQNKNLKIIDAISIIKDIVNSNSILVKKNNKNLQSSFENIKINNNNFKKYFKWKPHFTFIEGIKDLTSK